MMVILLTFFIPSLAHSSTSTWKAQEQIQIQVQPAVMYTEIIQ